MKNDDRTTKVYNMLFNGEMDEEIVHLLRVMFQNRIRCFLIGGAIRDAINDKSPRDLDIVLFDDNDKRLANVLTDEGIVYRRNAFHGYKLIFENTSIDVWLLKDHYVFRNNIYKANRENILKSTLINYDSLIYDLNKGILYSEYYDECLNNKVIDFVGKKKIIEANPKPILSIIKVMLIKRDKDFQFSDKVKKYIAEQFMHYGDEFWEQVSLEYKRHYSKDISQQLMKYIKQQTIESARECLPEISGSESFDGQNNVYDYYCIR